MKDLESIGATAATGLSIGTVVADANQWMQLGIAALTLLWWVRLWVFGRNDKQPPK